MAEPDGQHCVPVTIVTGFLGSGKSTLLNQVLQRKKHQKIAVLVNEFGPTMEVEKLSIVNDAQISTQDWIELENGCICCTVKDSAVIQLERLMDKKGPFDRVIIEASGVANPTSLINMFWLDDQLQGKVKIDGVICVVDCYTLNIYDIPPELFSQLALANVVLLNKTDLLDKSKAKLKDLLDFIKKINGTCKILETVYCDIASIEDDIFNCGGITNWSCIAQESTNEFHANTYDKYCISFGQCAIDKDRLEFFIQNLLWEHKLGDIEYPSMNVLRIKGVVKDANAQCFLIHAVGEIYEFSSLCNNAPISEFKVVFIGRNIPSLINTFSF